MKYKKIILFLFTLVLPNFLFSYQAEEHDRILREILFGQSIGYSEEKFELLCAASYLSIDFFNSSSKGVQCLQFLKKKKIKNLPKNIDDINYTDSSYHQRYTHRGWNFNYLPDKANWGVRKTILINTSAKIFKKNAFPGQIKDFSALVYYIHILGDHAGDSAKKNYRANRIPLTSEPGYLHNKSNGLDHRYNPTVYTELIFYIERLFKQQAKNGNTDFFELIRKLEKDKDFFQSATPEFIEQESKNHAKRTIELLKRYIPRLLKKEDFFFKSFYQ